MNVYYAWNHSLLKIKPKMAREQNVAMPRCAPQVRYRLSWDRTVFSGTWSWTNNMTRQNNTKY